MDTPKKIRRKPDGSAEPRSVDDILREAVEHGDFDNLPGKGRPLDLEEYFSAGEGNRIAFRLLKDNRVIPPHLQDRKEAEAQLRAAEDLLAREHDALQEVRKEISRAAQAVAAVFPDRRSLLNCFGLENWPPCFPEPAGKPPCDLPRLLAEAGRLSQLVTRHNRRAEALIARVLDILGEAGESLRRYHTWIASTGRFSTGYPPLAGADIASRKRELRETVPLLPALPEDLPDRLRDYFMESHLPIWKRILLSLPG